MFDGLYSKTSVFAPPLTFASRFNALPAFKSKGSSGENTLSPFSAAALLNQLAAVTSVLRGEVCSLTPAAEPETVKNEAVIAATKAKAVIVRVYFIMLTPVLP